MKKQRLTRCRRPRLSELPLVITACLAIPLAILAWRTGTGLEISLGGSPVGLAWESSHGALAEGYIQPVSCDATIAKAQRNSTDANRNRLFLRLIDDEPRFWISLHAKGYDKVRWGVMDHGKYYEQIEVSSNCIRVLFVILDSVQSDSQLKRMFFFFNISPVSLLPRSPGKFQPAKGH